MKNLKISKEIEFDAGHRVSTHGSKCRSPHGHRYKVEVTCEGPIIDDPTREDHGMLVDFGDLKKLMTEKIHDPLDHAMVIWKEDTSLIYAMQEGEKGEQPWKVYIFPYIPTAENIARWCWEQLEDIINTHFQDDLKLSEIAVWETPTSVAYCTGIYDEREKTWGTEDRVWKVPEPEVFTNLDPRFS